MPCAAVAWCRGTVDMPPVDRRLYPEFPPRASSGMKVAYVARARVARVPRTGRVWTMCAERAESARARDGSIDVRRARAVFAREERGR